MSPLAWAGRNAKRVGITIAGSVVLIAGILLIPLPGPGFIVIILGLLILAQEFVWAERLLDIAVEKAAAANTRAQGSTAGRIGLALSALGLLAGGTAIIVWFSTYIVVGFSLILGGVIGMVTLLPQTHAWIEERARTGINATDDAD